MPNTENLSKIIDMAIDGNIEGINSVVNDELMDRIQDVVAARKMEVAKNFFNSETPEENND